MKKYKDKEAEKSNSSLLFCENLNTVVILIYSNNQIQILDIMSEKLYQNYVNQKSNIINLISDTKNMNFVFSGESDLHFYSLTNNYLNSINEPGHFYKISLEINFLLIASIS